MGKSNKGKEKNQVEKDLFAVNNNNEEATQMEELNVNAPEVVENQGEVTEVGGPMEMEMELEGSEISAEMEEIVSEKVKQEEKQNQEQKSKRGPKPLTDEEKAAKKEEKKDDKKEKALNLKDINIIQREIKKGRLSAPQGRIEKTEAGDYIMKLADGIIFPQDAKDNFKEAGRIAKMNDGKSVITVAAATALNVDKFKAKHENGEEVEHDYVRVELHKPGRDKDVVELYTVREAKDILRRQEAVIKKKEEDTKKKEEKKAAENAKKEAEEKKIVEDKKEEQPTA